MPGRIAYVVGTAVAIVLVAGGCYDIPQPACGFTCGPPSVVGGEGTCPDGYVCFTSLDNRCHRVSPAFTETCPGDASIPPDLTPPQLRFRSPAPNDTDVPISAFGTIEVGFTEPVARLTDFPNFVVEDPDTGIIPGGVIELSGNPQSDNLWHYQYQTSRPLFANTIHTVRLTEQITDFANNAFIGEEWTFRTEVDDTPPTATVQNPFMVTGVPITTTIDVQFSEAVTNVTTSTFTLTGPSGVIGCNLSSGIPTTFSSLDPFSNLLPNTQYTVNLTSSITDLAGNPLTFTPFVFTTAADTTAPTVISTNPMSNSTNVSVAMSVGVSFSESVTGVSMSTFTLTGPSGVESAIVTTSPTNATLNPVHQLVPFTTYTFALTSAIVDLASNPLVAFTGNFTTGADSFPPNVIGRSPLNGATNVPVDTNVVVTFDEDVTNVNGFTFQVTSGAAISAVVSYQGFPNYRGTLAPVSQLAGNTTYTVVLASALQDTTGNMFGAPPSAWTFTTAADTIIPHVLGSVPADNATDVAVDATISVTFDEPVTNVDDTSFVVMNAGTGTYASANGGRTWIFTPDAAMPVNTTVTIMLTMAIQDGAGNALVPFAFDFTTVP